MAVRYGHIAHGDEDPFLSRARELLDIIVRVRISHSIFVLLKMSLAVEKQCGAFVESML